MYKAKLWDEDKWNIHSNSYNSSKYTSIFSEDKKDEQAYHEQKYGSGEKNPASDYMRKEEQKDKEESKAEGIFEHLEEEKKEKHNIEEDEIQFKAAKQIFIPFTVGGGISAIDDIRVLLNAGADKVSINTSAVKNPKLIKEAAEKFGSQCIVAAIDAKKIKNKWKVFIKGGRQATGLSAVEWAKKAERLGAGEILLTSMDKDGTKDGYDLELTKKISESVNIPIIASGGAGSLKSIEKVLKEGKADAALAASIFHYKKYSIKQVKRYLQNKGMRVRI